MSYDIISGKVIPAVTGGVFNFFRILTAETALLISPAVILAAYMINQAVMSDPDDATVWPLYISRMPDIVGMENNTGAIYDTLGLKDGRLMIGPVIQHYGIQIKIRSITHNVGWAKAEEISLDLDTILNKEVSIDDEDYVINNVKRFGNIIPLGTEEGTKGRLLFTVNFLVTLRRIV